MSYPAELARAAKKALDLQLELERVRHNLKVSRETLKREEGLVALVEAQYRGACLALDQVVQEAAESSGVRG